MEKRKPIKRDPALQPLSHDHQEGLMLSFRIKKALAQNVSSEKIMDYCRGFFDAELHRHFLVEERFLFPLLDKEHPMIKRACKEHRELKDLLFNEKDNSKAALNFAEKLEKHIRFEERELFNTIEEKTEKEALLEVNKQMASFPVTNKKSTLEAFW